MADNNPQSTSDSISDCESGISGALSQHRSPSPELFPARSSLIRLSEDDRAHRVVKQRFLSSSGLNPPAEVVAIYRRDWSVPSAQANLLAFQIYFRALAAKNSGDANVKYAWFGTSKSGIGKIVAHGFGHEEINRNSGGAVYGRGIYLSPDASPLASVQSTVEDEDGVRHVLLCRVLLGNVEAIQLGSIQTHASSDTFDSGVDDVVCPKRYIMWSTNMNTHILPEIVVSFRAVVDIPAAPPIPTSSWMSFHDLFQALSALLDPHALSSVKQRYKDFAEKRITREELVRCIRRVAGDNLLASIIKSSNPEVQNL